MSMLTAIKENPYPAEIPDPDPTLYKIRIRSEIFVPTYFLTVFITHKK